MLLTSSLQNRSAQWCGDRRLVETNGFSGRKRWSRMASFKLFGLSGSGEGGEPRGFSGHDLMFDGPDVP